MFRLRTYVKDYEIRESTDKRGTVKKVPVYVGPWFESVADDTMRKCLNRIYATMAVVMIALFLGCGFLDTVGSRNMVNALAYAFSCFPVVYNFIGMVATQRLGRRADRKEYDMSVRRMRHSAVGIMILYPIAIVSEIVVVLTGENKGNLLTESLYILLCGLMIAAAWLVQYLCRRYPYRERKEQE